MATIIEQEPLYTVLPVGQQIMFTVSNNLIVANQFNVKFCAEVHISNTPINLSVADDLIAVVKTTPNNKGVGIFDLRPFLESYVSPDYLGWTNGTDSSSYKATPFSNDNPSSIHIVDKYARSQNGMKYFAIQFFVEASTTANGIPDRVTGSTENSSQYNFFNGVVQYDDMLTVLNNNYGYDLSLFNLTGSTSTEGKFLSNAPITQDAQISDYGTLSFLNQPDTSIRNITFTFKDSAGSTLGTEVVVQSTANGGAHPITTDATNRLLYIGAFPGNLDNWSTTFKTHKANISSYTIQAKDSLGADASQEYTINIICPANSDNQKGFEGIRLCWLNQWGAWDYYTFNMKSIKSLTTNTATYSQQSGTWNSDTYMIHGYKGGKKNFRVNSTEKIVMNTDYVDEAIGVWFEELMNSPEVYVLEGYQTDITNSALNTYVQPVRLITSNYTRKTIANDKLMQYTFEVEKSKMKRTQYI